MTAEVSLPGDAIGPGDAIQPAGFALIVDHDWRVVRASANLGHFLGTEGAVSVGQLLAEVLEADAVHSLRNRAALMRDSAACTRLFACRAGGDQAPFDFVIRCVGDEWWIEGRPSGRSEHGDSSEVVRALIAKIDDHREMAALLAEAAQQLRALTGYDRVACYAIHDDGTGKLCAQSARQLGPAPDTLPAWLCDLPRLLIEGDRAGVPLVPPRPGDGGATMMFAVPSRQQQAWLNQRAAKAVMTGALRGGDASRGVIVCDHPAPRTVVFDQHATFELYLDMLAMKLEIAALRESQTG